LFIGALLVGTAARYAWQPERRGLMLVIWLQVLTMLVGTFGFVSGMIKTAVSAGNTPSPGDTMIQFLYALATAGVVGANTPSPGDTMIQGFGESLHNVGLGLGFVVLAGVAGAIGLARRTRGTGTNGSPVDPFA
jgi:hypothetical protein